MESGLSFPLAIGTTDPEGDLPQKLRELHRAVRRVVATTESIPAEKRLQIILDLDAALERAGC